MFDIGGSELLLIVIVAVVVIGPKDMPMALRTAGRWIGKMRKLSGHFRAGIDAMVREAELEDMERKWREHNEAIMKAHPDVPAMPGAEAMEPPASSAEGEPASLLPPQVESESRAESEPQPRMEPLADRPASS